MDRNSRRPVLTGLSLLFLAVACVSQNLSVYDFTKSLLLYEPVNPLLLPSNTGLRLDYDFNPLLSEKAGSRGDRYNSSVTSNDLNAIYYMNTSHWKYFLSVAYSQTFAAWREDNQDYSFKNDRKECDPSTGFLYKGASLSAGLGLGRHLSSHLPIEHFCDIRRDPARYLSEGPWRFTLTADYRIRSARLSLLLFSGPVHSSISELITRDGTGFRSFPVFLLKRTADLEAGININPVSVSIAGGVTGIRNADMLQYPNSMPQDIRITGYELSSRGCAKTPFTDSLYWKLSGNLDGGWAAGYNFDRKFTFFRVDSLRFGCIQHSAGLILPHKINCGLSGTYFSFSGPTGFLKLSAFSEWAAIGSLLSDHTLDYHYTDADFDYYESGIYINKPFEWKRFEFKGDLALSYIKTKMFFTYSEKKIVVLIPYYPNPKYSKPFNNGIILLTPSLTTLIHAGKCNFSLSAVQRIPFLIKSGGDGSNSDENGNEAKSHGKSSFTGGTSVKLSVEWHK